MAIELKSIASKSHAISSRVMRALGDAEMTSAQITEALGERDASAICSTLNWLEKTGRVERCGEVTSARGFPTSIWRARRAGAAAKSAPRRLPTPGPKPLTERVVAALGDGRMTSKQIAAELGGVDYLKVSAALSALENNRRVERVDTVPSENGCRTMIVWQARRGAEDRKAG